MRFPRMTATRSRLIKDNLNVDFQLVGSPCSGELNMSGAGWWWRPIGHCYYVNMNHQYHFVYNSKGDTLPWGIGWCDMNYTEASTVSVCDLFKFIEMKVQPKQWHCGNRPRITWETTQYRFLYREEEDEGGEDKTEMPTSNATIATPVPTVSEPVPDTENEHVASTDTAEERGSGNKKQLDMVSPVTEPVDKDKATTAPTTFTPGAEEGNTPDPAASSMTPPTPRPSP